MKASLNLLTLLFLWILSIQPLNAAVMEGAAGHTNQNQRQERLERRLDRVHERLEKRLERRKKKTVEIWGESRFRLGIIFLLGGLALALLGAILNTGFFGFLAGLAGLLGVALIVWALIEYYG